MMLFKARTSHVITVHITLLFASFLFFSSCLSRKETDYFQLRKHESGQESVVMSALSDPLVKPYDLLNIRVSSINMEAARFFNPPSGTETSESGVPVSYMVDSLGQIEMPLIGRIKVGGMTTRTIRDTLRLRLERFLQDPTLQVYFASFNITLLGEVKMPGLYNSTTEKITLTDAIGMAGDLTIYGDRKNVLLIRESDGKKNMTRIDMTSREIFSSPAYFLRPGDIVYVPAGKGRVASADAFYRIAPIVISALTLVTLLFYRIDSN